MRAIARIQTLPDKASMLLIVPVENRPSRRPLNDDCDRTWFSSIIIIAGRHKIHTMMNMGSNAQRILYGFILRDAAAQLTKCPVYLAVYP
jgi:hypothetical protein